jgi:DNA-binding response OmpR family regulator
VPDLTGRAVLICEDEAMIAFDIAAAVEDANGMVVGPFATVADAMAELDGGMPDFAVLDVNLLDGDVTPVLTRLIAANVPIVVNTGTRLPEDVSDLEITVFSKPADPDDLLAALIYEGR